MAVTVTTKGQVTIPKPVRDRLGIKPGHDGWVNLFGDWYDTGLPEATLFTGGPELRPEAVTHALGTAPHKASSGAHARWFWTTAGRTTSLDVNDHLRAVLALAEAFGRKHDAFPTAALRSSLFWRSNRRTPASRRRWFRGYAGSARSPLTSHRTKSRWCSRPRGVRPAREVPSRRSLRHMPEYSWPRERLTSAVDGPRATLPNVRPGAPMCVHG